MPMSTVQINELRRLCDAWLRGRETVPNCELINEERMAYLAKGLLHDYDELVKAHDRKKSLLTADGEAKYAGDKVYYVDPAGFVQGLDIGISFRTDSSVPETVYHPYPVYAHRENAEASKEC